MAAWLKTHPNSRADLEVLSFEAEALWHIVRLYCAAVGNNGRLHRDDLHTAIARKVSAAKAHKLAAELVRRGLWLDHGDTYELAGWLDDQPEAEVWTDDVRRERWARGKALRRDRDLCRRVQERDLNLCRYCGIRVNWTDRKGPNGGTYDHVDPDGLNTLGNVVVACRRCNGRKRERTPEQAGMPLLRPGTSSPTPPSTEPADGTATRPDIWPQSGPNQNPDPTGTKPESDRRPNSLAGARETGPNQNGIRSGLDRGEAPHGADGAAAVLAAEARVRSAGLLEEAGR